jgi:siroheme decarboxylase
MDARPKRNIALDELDRKIINRFQDGIEICAAPFATAAKDFGVSQANIVARLDQLLERGVLSRFGPMFHAERLGGGLTLAAMDVPEADFDRVADIVNRFPEVAHNYQRDHRLNMWFVLAVDDPARINRVIEEIEAKTGHKVLNMPKIEEFYVGLRFDV